MYDFFNKIISKVIWNSWKYFAFSSKYVAPVRDQAQTSSAAQINIWKNNRMFCKGVTEPNSLSTWLRCVMVTQNKLL